MNENEIYCCWWSWSYLNQLVCERARFDHETDDDLYCPTCFLDFDVDDVEQLNAHFKDKQRNQKCGNNYDIVWKINKKRVQDGEILSFVYHLYCIYLYYQIQYTLYYQIQCKYTEAGAEAKRKQKKKSKRIDFDNDDNKGQGIINNQQQKPKTKRRKGRKRMKAKSKKKYSKPKSLMADRDTEDELSPSETAEIEFTKWISKYGVDAKFNQIVDVLEIPPLAGQEIGLQVADLIWKC